MRNAQGGSFYRGAFNAPPIVAPPCTDDCHPEALSPRFVQMLSTGILDVASVSLHLWCWSRPRQRTGHSVTSPCEGILFGGLLGGSCCVDFFE